MTAPEYARGAAVMSLAVVGLCAVGLAAAWFEYDFSSGRQTPPGTPYHLEGNGVEARSLTFGAWGWDGDVEPSNVDQARMGTAIGLAGTIATGALGVLVALGEVPRIHRVINRRASLALTALAFVTALAAVTATFVLLPASMEGHGVEGAFTARLDEPDGYTHSQMSWGWYAVAPTPLLLVAAALFKFQAGSEGLQVIEAHARGES